MSIGKPVVVYGAPGDTGRLICEYLREFNFGLVMEPVPAMAH